MFIARIERDLSNRLVARLEQTQRMVHPQLLAIAEHGGAGDPAELLGHLGFVPGDHAAEPGDAGGAERIGLQNLAKLTHFGEIARADHGAFAAMLGNAGKRCAKHFHRLGLHHHRAHRAAIWWLQDFAEHGVERRRQRHHVAMEVGIATVNEVADRARHVQLRIVRQFGQKGLAAHERDRGLARLRQVLFELDRAAWLHEVRHRPRGCLGLVAPFVANDRIAFDLEVQLEGLAARDRILVVDEVLGIARDQREAGADFVILGPATDAGLIIDRAEAGPRGQRVVCSGPSGRCAPDRGAEILRDDLP